MSQVRILDIFKDKQLLKCHILMLDECAGGKIIQIYSYTGAAVAQVGGWWFIIHVSEK